MVQAGVKKARPAQGRQTLAVLDYGGQYAHLIARRVRALGVYAEIFAPKRFKPEENPDVIGVIFSGSPRSVRPAVPPLPSPDVEEVLPLLLAHQAGKPGALPVLGLCFGHQLMATAFGGAVEKGGGAREYGVAEARRDTGSRLFAGLGTSERVWMSHGDHVAKLPPGFKVSASTESLPIAAMEHEKHPLFGLQFHPEVTHTEHGNQMLRRFLEICGARFDWKPEGQVGRIVESIRAQAKGRNVFLLASGGVDSLVSLALCIRALGPERVWSLHVDTGFMRLGESKEIVDALRAQGFSNLHVAEAEPRFLENLKGIVDPEEKRARIGRLFVEVLHDEVGRLPLGDDWMLVQGTIYPDTIESGGTEQAARIKTHHNRVEEIDRMIRAGKVIEPLADLYKDEVRALGRELGLPEHLLQRHPFPGPGLAIRVLASHGGEPEAGFDRDEKAIQGFVAESGLGAAVLPVRTVGVQGDERTYRHAAVIWSQDPSAWPGWPALKKCAAALTNRFPSINRVLLALQPLPPGTLKLGRCLLEKPQLDKLREVDDLVLRRVQGEPTIWQVPVVALPMFDRDGRQAFVVRPVCSQDAMTAEVFEMEIGAWRTLAANAARIDGVGPLLYELTTKPPATIEWE
ncbi:MAG: glutamine-hydrolyzing GMP synthase [Myxococcales bacterium]